MAITKVSPSVISVANNVTSTTIGNTTSLISLTFDGSGVITSASNVAMNGAGITANTIANSAFQTGSIENYMRAQGTFAGMRNKIINGAMTIDQRNSGASLTPNGEYSVDRWYCANSQSAKFSIQRDSSANTVAGFASSLKVTSLSSFSSGSGDYFNFSQKIEGYNTADLAWGTASAKTVTLSFWVRSSLTGTFGGSINNSDQSRSYPYTYTIVAANTWEYKTVTIPGCTDGTWNTTTTTGIQVYFNLGTGTTYSGPAGSWASANYVSATGATAITGTNGATWYVTGVQFEAGSTPTPFEYRQYGTELQLCQRYYYKLAPVGSGLELIPGLNPGSTSNLAKVPLPVEMRTVPSISYSSAAWGFVRNSGSFTSYNTTGASMRSGSIKTYAYFDAEVASGLTSASLGMTAINDGSWLAFTAEL